MSDAAAGRQQGVAPWRRLQAASLGVGGVGAGLCAMGAWLEPPQFLRAYLVAYNYWLGIALGCLVILMIQHLTGGAWGIVSRRVLEAGTRTLPLLVVFFVPVLLGLPQVYPWARPGAAAGDPHLDHKAAYLNVPFFLVRAAAYFLSWLVPTYFLNRWSREQDETANPDLARRFRRLSGPAIIFYGLAVTFASIDWVMSLEPDWYSTIYGALVATTQILAGFAFSIVVLARLAVFPPFSAVLAPVHFQALGGLLLSFVMGWAYMAFSQFLLIWSGNLPEEIPWYLRRLRGGWEWVGLALALGLFAVPFLLLLSKDIKRNRRALAGVAGLVLLMLLVNSFWSIAPAFPETSIKIVLFGLVAAVTLGGLWLAFFLHELGRRPLLPVHDPFFSEVTEHG